MGLKHTVVGVFIKVRLERKRLRYNCFIVRKYARSRLAGCRQERSWRIKNALDFLNFCD